MSNTAAEAVSTTATPALTHESSKLFDESKIHTLANNDLLTSFLPHTQSDIPANTSSTHTLDRTSGVSHASLTDPDFKPSDSTTLKLGEKGNLNDLASANSRAATLAPSRTSSDVDHTVGLSADASGSSTIHSPGIPDGTDGTDADTLVLLHLQPSLSLQVHH